jgi:hypothetical protein
LTMMISSPAATRVQGTPSRRFSVLVEEMSLLRQRTMPC